mmetsp:Transcript_6011/g.14912  ORF Transcript_6011/g.14912 Transcript_6011/m.14912 type:complete len:337 (+) Transcript_6011:197-1207(+)
MRRRGTPTCKEPADLLPDMPDVAKLPRGTRSHAQRAKEHNCPQIRADDGPSDQKGKFHKEGQDAQSQERAGDDRGDGARRHGDAHCGERDSRPRLSVRGVIFDVCICEVYAVVDAEANDNNRRDCLGGAEVPPHDSSGADADDARDDSRDRDSAVKRQEHISSGHCEHEEHHREAHGEAEVHVSHKGQRGDGPQPEGVGGRGLGAGHARGCAGVAAVAEVFPRVLCLDKVFGSLRQADARLRLDENKARRGRWRRVAIVRHVPDVVGVPQLGDLQLGVRTHLGVEGVADEWGGGGVRPYVCPGRALRPQPQVKPPRQVAARICLRQDVADGLRGVD